MKEIEKEEFEKLKEEWRIIVASPLTQQIIQQKAAEILISRQNADVRKKQVEQEAETTIPALEVELSARQRELKQYDEERKIILDKVVAARLALAKERERIDYESSLAKAVLLSNYDPRIDEAILFLTDQHEALLRKLPDNQTREGKTDVFSMVKELVTFSNLPAIRRALDYCLTGIRALQAMRLTPALDVEWIEELKRGIPDVAVLTEFTKRNPFPRINSDPRSLLKSDSQLSWEMGKIEEKFKRIVEKS